MKNKYQYINPEIYLDVSIFGDELFFYRCPVCNDLSKWEHWRHFLHGNEIYNIFYNPYYNLYTHTCEIYENHEPEELRCEIENINAVISIHGCEHCNTTLVFEGSKLISPKLSEYKEPHKLLDKYPKSKTLFGESLAVANDSPRAALTLSRMCLESLVNDMLNEENVKPAENFKKNIKNFKKNIKELFKLKKIDEDIKDSLDCIRTIGNNSTHNFNLIESDDVTLDECEIVWDTINYILKSIQYQLDLKAGAKEIENRVKQKDNQNDRQTKS
ncbi:MAG: hypothetical protein ATN35_02870 [Epulopiscium sp. Nele67-Bin004]|nr:MAG: hypothetical protein ATN35_02870 [Epulopiscium sp. Nele67-Bin004]